MISALSWLTGAMSVQLDRQVQDVLGLLENAQGFRQVTNAQRGIAARKVVHQVLHSLQRLGGAFGGVLPAEEHARAAGHVLQAVLQSVIGELFHTTFWQGKTKCMTCLAAFGGSCLLKSMPEQPGMCCRQCCSRL